jgi:hypothetical protein
MTLQALRGAPGPLLASVSDAADCLGPLAPISGVAQGHLVLEQAARPAAPSELDLAGRDLDRVVTWSQ